MARRLRVLILGRYRPTDHSTPRKLEHSDFIRQRLYSKIGFHSYIYHSTIWQLQTGLSRHRVDVAVETRLGNRHAQCGVPWTRSADQAFGASKSKSISALLPPSPFRLRSPSSGLQICVVKFAEDAEDAVNVTATLASGFTYLIPEPLAPTPQCLSQFSHDNCHLNAFVSNSEKKKCLPSSEEQSGYRTSCHVKDEHASQPSAGTIFPTVNP
jgi:hypothetical protein